MVPFGRAATWAVVCTGPQLVLRPQTQGHGVWGEGAQGLTSLDKCAHSRLPCNPTSALGFPCSALRFCFQSDSATSLHPRALILVQATIISCLPKASLTSQLLGWFGCFALQEAESPTWAACQPGSSGSHLRARHGLCGSHLVRQEGAQLPCVFAPLPPPPVYLLEGLWGCRKPPQHQRNLHRAARGDLERQSQHSLSASQVPAPLDKPHPHPTRPMWAHLTALPVQAPLTIENLGLDSSHATQPPHLAQGRVDWVRGHCPRAFTLEA